MWRCRTDGCSCWVTTGELERLTLLLDEQSGSVAASGVLGRVRDGFVVPPVLLTVGGLGIVLAVVGAGLGISGYAARRAARRPLAAAPPWPAV